MGSEWVSTMRCSSSRASERTTERNGGDVDAARAGAFTPAGRAVMSRAVTVVVALLGSSRWA